MKRPYLKSFFSAFFIFLISILPILAVTKGAYLSLGDYNQQSVIFTEHINNLLHSRDGLPMWDWKSDLGMDTVVSYGGFMFSPFEWILFALPVTASRYVHTVIAAVKIGLSAVFACLYCMQYVKKTSSAYVCGLLYAFSGFQLFNLCYQFADTICIFPLTVYCFDKLVTEKKPGAFAFMLALNGYVNYYFLWEECVFLLIYYIVRTVKKDYPRLDLKLFARLGAETLGGVAMSAALLLPSALSIVTNQRAGKLIFDANLLAYEDDGVILSIIQSFFLPPAFLTYAWYFDSRQLTLSTPTLFIPLFTVIGAAAVFRKNRKSWENMLLAICAVIACVPLFNSIFSMLNFHYYSRWFHMPLLIMIMMTGKYIDDIENYNVDTELKINGAVLGILAVFGIYSVYISKDDDVAVKNLWLMSIVTAAVCLGIMYLFSHPNKNISIFSVKNLGKIVCAVCLMFFLERSVAIIQCEHSRYVYDTSLALWNDNVPVNIQDDVFFRTTTADSYSDNSSFIWGYPTVDTFNSLVTGEECSFYQTVGIKRTQGSYLESKDHAILSFLSVKYWLHYNEPTDLEDLIDLSYVFLGHEGFNDFNVYNRYLVYENSAFIPMGFTYDHYMDIDDFVSASDNSGSSGIGGAFMKEDESDKHFDPDENQKLLLKAIWLDKDQIERYSDILTPLPDELMNDTSDETYYTDCKNRAASSCYEFVTNNNGFDAAIRLEKDNLVFFSVPFTNGFTAYVDGEKTDIERVFGGLSAVYVPSGDHKISFVYETPGLKTGICISLASAAFIVIYTVTDLIVSGRRKKT